jgi:hypothetical protein
VADGLAEGYGMAKEEVVEARAPRQPRAQGGARPQAAPAAVDDTPSAEEAAAIAASTVFEPDVPEPEIVAEGATPDDVVAEEPSPAVRTVEETQAPVIEATTETAEQDDVVADEAAAGKE